MEKRKETSEDIRGVYASEAGDVTIKEFAIKKKLHKQVPRVVHTLPISCPLPVTTGGDG